MKASTIALLLYILLTSCATPPAHRRCIQYMWVPNVDMGHVGYVADRPVCVQWTAQ